LDEYVRGVVVEPQYVCRDFRDIYSHFYSKKFLERSSLCHRLHFFNVEGVDERAAILESEQFAENYIGYSVIQPVRQRCLGRSIFDPTRLGFSASDTYCLSTRTTVQLNGANYTANGYPYISQTGEALVCAHASLWGACRYLSDRYQVYGELHPYDLIRLTSSNSGRRIPYRGMSYSDYSEILTAFGCHPEIIIPTTSGRDWTHDTESFYDVYSYIESGFPVLVSFRGHVATIVGVRYGDDLRGELRDANTPFHNSLLMVDGFVVVDDNFFPYQHLGYADDPENYGEAFVTLQRRPSIDSIYAAVVPLAEKVFLPARKARELLYGAITSRTAMARLQSTLQELGIRQERLVARTFLTNGSAFKKRKRQCLLGEVGEADRLCWLSLDANLPHFIWIMEIATTTGFRQRRIVAEIVLDATTNKDEGDRALIYMRIGNVIITPDGEQEFEGPMNFVQFTHNLGERDV
jgi:hypothetical protein